VTARRARPGGARAWGAVRFRAPEALVEELLARLPGETTGAEVRATGPGASEAIVYLEEPAAARRVAGRIREALRRSGREAEAEAVGVTSVIDEGWVELYQASLVPFLLGRGFAVYPRGRIEGARIPARVPLLLEPGRAFGTGEHPTTRLVVEALERVVGPGSRWIDLGCGTGILALVARHCGAREVLALDVDPEAVAVARAVTRANRVSGIDVAQGGLERAGHGHDGIAANILAPFFVGQPAALAEPLTAGGVLVASGFLAEELGPVRAALAGAGWVEIESALDGGWASLTLTAPPSSRS
jgi:ribosomal protein L11 methyltransferase